jgi:hypothetical protein
MTPLPPPLVEPAGARPVTMPLAAFALRRVESREDWREVRALREGAQRSGGDLADSIDALPDDGFDAALNSTTYLLTLHGRPVGTTRTSVSSASRRWPLPAIETFRKALEAAIGWEATIVEASLCVTEPTLPGDSRDALFHLMRAPMRRCAMEDADWLIVAVPASQIGFHRRMLNMEILSGCERCPRLARPRVLMGLEYRRQAAVLYARIPALAWSEGAERVLA